MKKLLSVLLTVVMLVVPVAEMTAFAAPSIADSFDAAVETIEFSADGEEIAPDDEIADLEAEITYTVSFDANGGENPPLFQTKTEYKNLAITASLPTREGYTFAGWALSPTATVADYVPGSVYTEDKDVTLFAVWSDKYHGYESVAASFKVCATPHYFMTGYEPTYNNGYESLMLYEIPNGNGGYTNLRNEIYLTPEQLGIEEGTADDYFLSCFDLLVVMDENNQIHSILSAKSKLVKKTVTDLEFCEVTSNKVSSYLTDTVMDVYGNNVETMTKVLSGKILAGTEEIYAYNAPFTYLEPTYYDIDDDGDVEAWEKYYLRNVKNVINYNLTKHVEGDVEVFELTGAYSLVDWYYATSDDYAPDATTPDTHVAWEDEAQQLIEKLPLVYYGGLYEADIYDVDGDGVYEYIDYKPYSVFQVDTDEDEDFAYSTFTATTGGLKIPYIYTEGATVTGEAFADEDVVLGYFNEDNETVHVVEVIKPTVASVDNYKTSTATLILSNGDKVDGASKWRMVNNYIDVNDVSETGNLVNATSLIYDFKVQTQWEVATSAFFDEAIIDSNDEYDFYIKDGVVLCSSPVNAYSKFAENLIIPTTLGGLKAVKEGFDPVAGITHYVYAYVDGAAKYVQVAYDEDFDTYGPVDLNGNLNSAYEDKLCTYTESNGVYTIVPLSIDVYHEDDVALNDYSNPVTEAIRSNLADLDETDEEYQYYADNMDVVSIEKIAGSRFYIKENGTNVLGTKSVELKSYTKIVVRVEDPTTGKFTYEDYDAASFTKSLDAGSTLDNVSIVVSNNVDSKNKENLVLLYGETDDFNFQGTVDKSGLRVVSGYEIDNDEDSEWRYYYDLYNPFTGAKNTHVASVNSSVRASSLDTPCAIGSLVRLYDGEVDDDTNGKSYIADLDNLNNLVWIAEVDTKGGFIQVVPYNSSIEDIETDNDGDGKEDGDDEVVDYVENYAFANDVYGITKTATGDIGFATLKHNYIDYDSNTVVAVVSYAGAATSGDFWKAANIKLSTMEDVAAKKKELLAYKSDAVDKNGNEKTKYSDFVKAYIAVDESDFDEKEQNAVAEFILIIVNDGEVAAEDKLDNPNDSIVG